MLAPGRALVLTVGTFKNRVSWIEGLALSLISNLVIHMTISKTSIRNDELLETI